jgi:hypothetical protein
MREAIDAVNQIIRDAAEASRDRHEAGRGGEYVRFHVETLRARIWTDLKPLHVEAAVWREWVRQLIQDHDLTCPAPTMATCAHGTVNRARRILDDEAARPTEGQR